MVFDICSINIRRLFLYAIFLFMTVLLWVISTKAAYGGCVCTSKYSTDPKYECCGTGPDEGCGCERCGSNSCNPQWNAGVCDHINCVNDPDPPPPPPPTCSFNYLDKNLEGIGDTEILATSSLNIPSGRTISSMTFNLISGASIAVFSPNPITNGTTITNITSTAIGGLSTYRATMILNDGITCSDNFNVSVDIPPGWCQIKEGDAIVGHRVRSPGASINIPVPYGSYLASYDAGNYPGVPIAARLVNTDPGETSYLYNWKVENSAYAGVIPSYWGLRNKLPIVISSDTGSFAGNYILTNSGSEYPGGSGYYYFAHTGNITLQEGSTPGGTINLGSRRVVVFVDGSVEVNSKVRVDDGLGFFMLVASGNISVHKNVRGTNDGIPELEGIYLTDNWFTTGSEGPGLGADQQLHIRGSVVAGRQVLLQRNLSVTDIPAEIFEYAPDQNILIPPKLSERSMTWKEVLP